MRSQFKFNSKHFAGLQSSLRWRDRRQILGRIKDINSIPPEMGRKPVLKPPHSARMWKSNSIDERAMMARTNPLQYVQQVRSEVSKVVWPTRREVMLTTVMVFIMSALTAIFFAIIDIIIRSGLTGVLGFFG